MCGRSGKEEGHRLTHAQPMVVLSFLKKRNFDIEVKRIPLNILFRIFSDGGSSGGASA